MKHSLHILYKSALVIILSIMGIEKMDAQMIAVRNNVVYDATMSPNIGFELVVGERKTISIDFMGNYKPLGKDMKKITSRFNIDFHAGFGVIGYKQKEYYEGDHFDQDYMEGNKRTNASGYTLLPTNIGVSVHYILK